MEVSLTVADDLLAVVRAAAVGLAASVSDGANVFIAAIALVEYRSKLNVTLVIPPIGGRCWQAASKAYRSV